MIANTNTMGNTMMGGYPYPQQPMMNGTGYVPGVMPQQMQNGIVFGNLPTQITDNLTPEEKSFIKSFEGNNFSMSPQETALAAWNFRDGDKLQVEVVNAKENKLAPKGFPNLEFQLVVNDDNNEVLNQLIIMLRNYVYTAKVTNSLDPKTSKELYIAHGILEKLLPIAMKAGKKNMTSWKQQLQNSVQPAGYWGSQNYNGYGNGTMANYTVVNNGMGMQYGMPQQTPMMPQQVPFQAPYQQAPMMGQQGFQQIPTFQTPMMPQGQYYTGNQPVGGTIMNSPFYSQQPTAAPTVAPAAAPSVPAPGVPKPAAAPTSTPSAAPAPAPIAASVKI